MGKHMRLTAGAIIQAAVGCVDDALNAGAESNQAGGATTCMAEVAADHARLGHFALLGSRGEQRTSERPNNGSAGVKIRVTRSSLCPQHCQAAMEGDGCCLGASPESAGKRLGAPLTLPAASIAPIDGSCAFRNL